MTLYIVRHGKSVANTLNIVNGKQDDPLTTLGSIQIQRLKKKIEELEINPSLFYTTPWLRAQQSAKILWPNAPWIVESRLGETDAGDVATLTVNQFIEFFPNFHNSPINKYPNGESHIDLNIRVISWLEELKEKLSESDEVVVVTHAGPISCIWQYILCIDMSNFPAFLQPNASLSSVKFSDLMSAEKKKNLTFNFLSFE